MAGLNPMTNEFYNDERQLLPLPRGEGWGEGQTSKSLCAFHVPRCAFLLSRRFFCNQSGPGSVPLIVRRYWTAGLLDKTVCRVAGANDESALPLIFSALSHNESGSR
jgi:hypothetical protein